MQRSMEHDFAIATIPISDLDDGCYKLCASHTRIVLKRYILCFLFKAVKTCLQGYGTVHK